MFEARFAKGSLLHKLVDAVKDIVDCVNLNCTQEGLFIQARNEMGTVAVRLGLPADGFAMYRCDRAASFGVNLKSVARILGGAASDSPVEMSARDDGRAEKMTFKFMSGHGHTNCYALRLLALPVDDLVIPDDIVYGAQVTMSSVLYKNVVSALSAVGPKLTIDVREKKISFDAHGELTSASVVKWDGEQFKDVPVTVAVREQFTGAYCSGMLSAVGKACSVADTVTIEVDLQYPILLKFELADDAGFMHYYVACVPDDEEED